MTRTLFITLTFCGLTALLAAQAPTEVEIAALRADLLRGVEEIGRPGLPGPVAALSTEAFVVAATRNKDGSHLPLIVAARPERGRAVLFGHGGYLSRDEIAKASGGRLVANAFRFVAADRKEPRVGLVGHGHLRALLEGEGFAVENLEDASWPKRLAKIDVLVLGQDQVKDAAEAAALVNWVRSGGGLVASGLIWGWEQLNPRRSSTDDLFINQALRDLGLMLCGGYIGEVLQPDAATPAILDACHGGRALEFFEHQGGDRKVDVKAAQQCGQVLTTILRWWPAGDESFPERLRNLVEPRIPMARPTAEKPLATRTPLLRLALVVDHLNSLRADPVAVKAAATAQDFPGQPSEGTKTVQRRLLIDPSIPGWHSTGLFARAGQAVTIEVPEDRALGRLRLRIGAHTDLLWDKPSWKRHPELSRIWPLLAAQSSFASPHGGLVYVELPKADEGKPFSAIITGAVEAPLFVLGETSASDWKSRIRKLDAPWAELACRRVILTVRSSAIRELEDPTELMQFWEKVLDLYPVLGQRPAPKRPERFVSDLQISAGYLHSGYPIMMQIHHSEEIVALKALRDAPPEESHGWGFWHELGHNHQRSDWTFGGTTEVTCNLFSLFVDDQIRGVEPAKHSWPASSRMKVAKHVEGKRDFEQWKKDPGLALWTYILIQEEFGWQPFEQVFKDYEALDAKARPKNDQEKRDQFMERMSGAIGRDLGPYFEAWGIPITKEARARTADLKPWMPQRIAAFRQLLGQQK